MGQLMARLMLDKGVTLVGVIDTHPDLVGRDVGEVLGLPSLLNITVSDDAEEVLSTSSADIAIVSLVSEFDAMEPFLTECITNRLNVISTSREVSHGWTVSPAAASRIHRLAQQYGVTVTASGFQDIFLVNQVSMLSGASHEINRIILKSQYDVNEFGAVVAKDMRVGWTPQEVLAEVEAHGPTPSYIRFCIEAIASDLGLTISSLTQSTVPVTEAFAVECTPLDRTIESGLVTGLTEVTTIQTHQGVSFHGEWTGKVYGPNEADTTECRIEGKPNLEILNRGVDPSATTCTQMVNRIPDVINAPAGYVTYEKLPKLRYRAYPFDTYVTA